MHRTITECWAEMVESRDGTTGSHVRNTTVYLRKFFDILLTVPKFQSLLSTEMIDELSWASTMHDIGKVGISDSVLKKPGPLTFEEMKDMQRHSMLGAELIQKIINSTKIEDRFLSYARDMALWHHERWDGTGYPQGLIAEAIPLHVQILSITDVYDALTSIRPYKRAFTHKEALDIIQNDRGKFFSPELVDIFAEYNEEFRYILEHEKQQ